MAFYTTTKLKNYQSSTEILSLVAAFEDCTLPLAQWNRETCLTLAFWYLYLNSPAEAERLMSEAIARYNFEHGLNLKQFEAFESAEIPLLLRALNDCIRIYKSGKSFVALANLILERFADKNRQLENYRRARAFFPKTVINPLKVGESR